jgi:putative ribosome biogenesis GTPase RsgA
LDISEEFTEEFGMEESRLKPGNGQMIIISTINNNMNTTTMNGTTIKRKIMDELLEKEEADDQQLINSSKKSTEVKVSMVKPMNKNKKQFLDVPRIVKAKWTTGPMPIRAKVILLGEAGVGKTSLVYSLKYGCTRLLQCNSTIGAHQNTFDMLVSIPF